VETKTYISTTNKAPLAVDFELLKKEGLAQIEKLASQAWTDYNAHDPGITILEALCYALVDVGYRFQFDIKDLLTFEEGEPKPEDTLYKADKIFTTQPVTINDYRKLFIDIPGVANAWLIPKTAGKPDFYVDKKNEVLTHAVNDPSVLIKGRYDIFLELENNENYGDLNNKALYYTLAQGPISGNTLELRTGLTLDKKDNTWQRGSIVNRVVSAGETLAKGRYAYSVGLKVKHGGSTKEYSGKVLVTSNNKELSKAQIRNALIISGPRSILETWLKREQAVVEILNAVGSTYHANRNLCEDLNEASRVGLEEIGFCFDITSEDNADLEVLEARIWYEIDKYLNPRVNFYSERELREEGRATEEIFDGPRLSGGFIKTEELQASEMRSKVFASDVINLIMDVEGVVNLTNFSMTKYNEWGVPSERNKKWEISISTGSKPLFSQSKSKTLFLKQGVPFITRKSETRELFEGLKMADVRIRVSAKGSPDFSNSTNRSLNKFISVVNELPQLYGVSIDGLPSTVNLIRKNSAKQLKGYLMLFDQLLTNYLAQLNKFKSWVSLDNTLSSSYFSQLVEGIRDGDELYENKIEYENSLPGWLEDETLFLERRNKVLDHLLARVNEQVSHHNLALYFKNREENQILTKGVVDKIEYLKSYPETSYKRAGAPNVLNSEQQGGWLKKLFRQLGVHDNSSVSFMPYYRTKLEEGDVKHSVVWKTRTDDKTLFSANKWFDKEEEARNFNDKMFNQFAVKGAEVVVAGSKWRVQIEDDGAKMRSNLISTKPLAKAFLEKWTTDIQVNSETGVMIENILLRPLNTSYEFIVDCIDSTACGTKDPYSFRATIVLPYWPENFRNMNYRNYIERAIRTLLPAHTMPKICWVSWEPYVKIEDKFNQWLQKRNKMPWPFEITAETNELILALRGLTTVYPEAVLHDCEDDQDENPVILNQTKLGNF
jgi:hypothetical protein